jgi:hypothetical protein
MGDWPAPSAPGAAPAKACISTIGNESGWRSVAIAIQGGGSLSTGWFGANVGIILPMILTDPFLVSQVGWENGATLSGNIEVAWWNSTLSAAYVTTGSVVQAGVSTMQTVDVTDTTIPAGTSYVVFIASSATSTVRTVGTSARTSQVGGIRQFSGAVPITTITPAQASSTTLVPLVAFSSRAVL